MAADALVVADSASRGEGYLTHLRSSGECLSIGFENDVEISPRNRPDI